LYTIPSLPSPYTPAPSSSPPSNNICFRPSTTTTNQPLREWIAALPPSPLRHCLRVDFAPRAGFVDILISEEIHCVNTRNKILECKERAETDVGKISTQR
jgi:hypothetical protein